MSGTLFLMPCTLGGPAVGPVLPVDVCRIASRLDYYIAENAKSARAFLKQVDAVVALERPLQQIEIRELHVSTAASEWPLLLEPLLAGRDAALLSEAGCPAVADPGAGLVALAHRERLNVRPLVGPSSILLALMASGLNGQRFAFEGYLPVDAAQRRERLAALEARSRAEGQTQIMIETPYRNRVLLDALLGGLDARTRLCVAWDLTLDGETVCTQSVAQWRSDALELPKRPAIFLFQA